MSVRLYDSVYSLSNVINKLIFPGRFIIYIKNYIITLMTLICLLLRQPKITSFIHQAGNKIQNYLNWSRLSVCLRVGASKDLNFS